jgi:hypothetical protein
MSGSRRKILWKEFCQEVHADDKIRSEWRKYKKAWTERNNK